MNCLIWGSEYQGEYQGEYQSEAHASSSSSSDPIFFLSSLFLSSSLPLLLSLPCFNKEQTHHVDGHGYGYMHMPAQWMGQQGHHLFVPFSCLTIDKGDVCLDQWYSILGGCKVNKEHKNIQVQHNQSTLPTHACPMRCSLLSSSILYPHPQKQKTKHKHNNKRFFSSFVFFLSSHPSSSHPSLLPSFRPSFFAVLPCVHPLVPAPDCASFFSPSLVCKHSQDKKETCTELWRRSWIIAGRKKVFL